MHALLAHLQQEIQVRLDCCNSSDSAYQHVVSDLPLLVQQVDALEAQQMQAPGFPAGICGHDGAHDSSMGEQQKQTRHSFSQAMISPAKRQLTTANGLYNIGHDPSMQLPGNGQIFGQQDPTAGY